MNLKSSGPDRHIHSHAHIYIIMYLSSRDTDDILFCPIQGPSQLEGSPSRQTFQIYVLGQADKPCIDISFLKCLGVIVCTYICRASDMKTGVGKVGGDGGDVRSSRCPAIQLVICRSAWTARLCFKETNNKKFLVIQSDTQQKADPANP